MHEEGDNSGGPFEAVPSLYVPHEVIAQLDRPQSECHKVPGAPTPAQTLHLLYCAGVDSLVTDCNALDDSPILIHLLVSTGAAIVEQAVGNLVPGAAVCDTPYLGNKLYELSPARNPSSAV